MKIFEKGQVSTVQYIILGLVIVSLICSGTAFVSTAGISGKISGLKGRIASLENIVTGKPTAKVELKFYACEWEGGYEGAKKISAIFEKENPEVDVDVIRGPSTWDAHVARTSTWMKTDYSGIDLLYQDDVFTLEGAVSGDWVDLGPYLTDKEKSWYTDFQKRYIKTQGGYFRVPWFNGMSLIYYRKDLFRKAGVDVPKTWDELVKVAKKLTKDIDGDGVIDQWGYVTQGTPGEMYNTFNEFLHQAGGDEWKLAKDTNGDGVPDTPYPEAEKALRLLVDLEFKYKVMPPGITDIGYDKSSAMFRGGKAAMLRAWNREEKKRDYWGIKEKVGEMNFPAGSAGPWGIGDCWGLVLNNHGKHKKWAIKFAKFNLRPDIQKTFTIGAPATKPPYKDKEYMSKLPEKVGTWVKKAKEYSKWRFVRRLPPGRSTEFHEAFGRVLSLALTGTKTVKEALIDMQKTINPLLPKK